jgi:four helix bundle protein
MNSAELKDRTYKFAKDMVALVAGLPKDNISYRLEDQLLRCATSVAANYRSSCRARSTADFISKITIVEEEADESGFWLDLLFDAKKISKSAYEPLKKESVELTAIFTASGKTAKQNNPKSTIRNPKPKN